MAAVRFINASIGLYLFADILINGSAITLFNNSGSDSSKICPIREHYCAHHVEENKYIDEKAREKVNLVSVAERRASR